MDANVAEGMRRMGASEEDIARAVAERPQAEEGEDAFEVYEDNWDTWLFFLRVQHQWVYAGMAAARVGLNWQGIAAWAGLALVGRRRLAREVPALELIERAVLAEDNRIAARRAKKGRA